MITKLQLRPRDQETAKALQLFRKRLDKSVRAKTHDTRLGLGLFAVIAIIIVILILRC